jgi:hypothetical protein
MCANNFTGSVSPPGIGQIADSGGAGGGSGGDPAAAGCNGITGVGCASRPSGAAGGNAGNYGGGGGGGGDYRSLSVGTGGNPGASYFMVAYTPASAGNCPCFPNTIIQPCCANSVPNPPRLSYSSATPGAFPPVIPFTWVGTAGAWQASGAFNDECLSSVSTLAVPGYSYWCLQLYCDGTNFILVDTYSGTQYTLTTVCSPFMASLTGVVTVTSQFFPGALLDPSEWCSVSSGYSSGGACSGTYGTITNPSITA